MEEPIVQDINMIKPGNPNADEQTSVFVKAMKFINAATYSLSDLQRAQRTDQKIANRVLPSMERSAICDLTGQPVLQAQAF